MTAIQKSTDSPKIGKTHVFLEKLLPIERLSQVWLKVSQTQYLSYKTETPFQNRWHLMEQVTSHMTNFGSPLKLADI